MKKTAKKLLVMGIGNLIMGDEGVGVHVVQQLAQEQLPDFVECLDGGTGSFYLLEHMQSADRIVLIDAAAFDDAPGSIRVLTPQFSNQYPRTLTAHEAGLKDLIDWFNLTGSPPDIRLIAVTINPNQDIELGLTPPVEAAKGKALQLVKEQIELFRQEVTQVGSGLGK